MASSHGLADSHQTSSPHNISSPPASPQGSVHSIANPASQDVEVVLPTPPSDAGGIASKPALADEISAGKRPVAESSTDPPTDEPDSSDELRHYLDAFEADVVSDFDNENPGLQVLPPSIEQARTLIFPYFGPFFYYFLADHVFHFHAL